MSSIPLISQIDNFAGNFGDVHRSSAIFWIKNDKFVQTTIAISNYWQFKNCTTVIVDLTVRCMDGSVFRRIPVNFNSSEIYNFRLVEDFEGSVEVNALCTENIKIPYAAVMGLYECVDSISMVHSYSRVYSEKELEEHRVIEAGEESCWTLRETGDMTSFAVLHNGAAEQGAQTIILSIRNYQGKEKVFELKFNKLKSYETVLIEIRKHCPDIVKWLDGRPGNGRVSFKVNGAFTRMLCGIKKLDGSQLQVTHSNFDYSKHTTDKVDGESVSAYMITPNTKGANQQIVIYPDTDNGLYRYKVGDYTKSFKTGDIEQISFNNDASNLITFGKEDGRLPTRIVTGLRLYSNEDIIPAECSLGITHQQIPKKHFAWMVVSKKFQTDISWVDFREVYGGCPSNAELTFKLYEVDRKLPAEKRVCMSSLPTNQTIELRQLFPDVSFTDNSYCYLTVWCSYGGLVFFSSLKKHDSITIEHSF